MHFAVLIFGYLWMGVSAMVLTERGWLLWKAVLWAQLMESAAPCDLWCLPHRIMCLPAKGPFQVPCARVGNTELCPGMGQTRGSKVSLHR